MSEISFNIVLMSFRNFLVTNDLVKIKTKEMSFNDIPTCDKQVTANLFSGYFSTIYSTVYNDINTDKLDIFTFDLLNNVDFRVDDGFQNLSDLCSVWSIELRWSCYTFLFKLKSIFAYPL